MGDCSITLLWLWVKHSHSRLKLNFHDGSPPYPSCTRRNQSGSREQLFTMFPAGRKYENGWSNHEKTDFENEFASNSKGTSSTSDEWLAMLFIQGNEQTERSRSVALTGVVAPYEACILPHRAPYIQRYILTKTCLTPLNGLKSTLNITLFVGGIKILVVVCIGSWSILADSCAFIQGEKNHPLSASNAKSLRYILLLATTS